MFLNEEDFSKDESLICPSEFDFSSLLFNPLFSDFTIHVPNPPQGKQSIIPTHRFILDSFSGYFHQFFETTPNEKEISVCFPDWATFGIYIILEYFYSQKPINLSVDNISPLVCIAFSWSIESIKEELIKFLSTSIPVKNSLPILSKVLYYVPNYGELEKSLIELAGIGISLFSKSQFEDLPYLIFIKIIDRASLNQQNEKTANSICDAIENYFQKNIVKLGSHEYSQLIKKFTMKSNHNGIINLYKIGLIYGWNVRLVESKILHAWKNLDQKMLSELPIQSLKKLLHENFLNIDNEDDLVDFIFLVYKNHSFDIDTKLNTNDYSSFHSNVKSFSVSNFKSNFSSNAPPVASHSVLNLALSATLDSSTLFVDLNSSNFKTAASDLYSSTTSDGETITTSNASIDSTKIQSDINSEIGSNIHIPIISNISNTSMASVPLSNNNSNSITGIDSNANSIITQIPIANSNCKGNLLIIKNSCENNKNNDSIDIITKNKDNINNDDDDNDKNKEVGQSEEDMLSSLWKELRICFLSKNSIERLYSSPLVPKSIKKGIGAKIGTFYQAPRLPRTKVKCLILGACDDSALRDVRNLIISTSFEESNVVSIRADREFDLKMIFDFHSIFIFGFFKFWNKKELSMKLREFHNEGGGVFVCYGTHRSDDFGIGEPFLSCLPIEHVANPDLTTEFVVVDKRKTRFEGCKYMRIVCRARNDGFVENYWDDGVPFLIRKGRDKEGHGAIYILNATPVSSDIIDQQWKYKDKHIQHMVSNAIIYVSNVIISKRKLKNT